MGIPKEKGTRQAYLRKGLTAFLGTIAGLAVTLCATLVFGKGAGLLGQTGNENILFQHGLKNPFISLQAVYYNAILFYTEKKTDTSVALGKAGSQSNNVPSRLFKGPVCSVLFK